MICSVPSNIYNLWSKCLTGTPLKATCNMYSNTAHTKTRQRTRNSEESQDANKRGGIKKHTFPNEARRYLLHPSQTNSRTNDKRSGHRYWAHANYRDEIFCITTK